LAGVKASAEAMVVSVAHGAGVQDQRRTQARLIERDQPIKLVLGSL
jgi:hypothetical protein